MCWLYCRGWLFVIGAWHENGLFIKALNLRVLAPLSRLAFVIEAWLVLEWIFQSPEFAGVGSAVEDGFYYRRMACIRMAS